MKHLKSLITTVIWSISLSANAQLVFTEFNLNANGASHPKDFCIVNGKLFFTAEDSATGREVWVSDGTAAGTAMIKDICSINLSDYEPSGLTPIGNKLFFFEYDNLYGIEPHISDGTYAGTVLLKNINYNALHSFVNPGTVVLNGKIIFSANGQTFGNELWITDGTSAGTVLLKDIKPLGSSNPNSFIEMGSRVYFVANQYELWQTDGTTSGTVLVKNTYTTGSAVSGIQSLRAQNGKVYFETRDTTYHLWVSDGTTAGTKILANLHLGDIGSQTVEMITYNSKVYFAAHDTTNGRELWRTDGTIAGTTMLKNIGPGKKNGVTGSVTQSGHAQPGSFIIYQNKLFFAGNDDVKGNDLWYTDGTATNTLLAHDIAPLHTHSEPYGFFNYKGKMYFCATILPGDYQLMCYQNATTLPKTVAPSLPSPLFALLNSYQFIEYNNAMYFAAAYNNDDVELWRMEDTTTTTTHISGNYAANNNITLYPNPAHHNLTIKTTAPFMQGSITITDLAGRVVKTEKPVSTQTTILLNGIAPGMYITDIWLDDRHSTQKLLVE